MLLVDDLQRSSHEITQAPLIVQMKRCLHHQDYSTWLVSFACCPCYNFLPPRQQLIGFAGRLSPEKGPGLFMAAAEALSELLPSAVFVVVGDGPLRIALEAAAGRSGIAR